MSAFLERRRYELLLGVILLGVLVYPLLIAEGVRAPWVLMLVLSLMLLAALNAVRVRGRRGLLLALLGLTAVAAVWSRLTGRGDMQASLQYGLSAVFLVLVAWLVLKSVLAAGRITGERVVAAICVYMLLGFIWANLYSLVEVHYGSVFSRALEEYEITYFSYVTLTTLGYGDIVPVHTLARSLALLEAATGVLFVAVLIARLVALQIMHAEMDAAGQNKSS